MSCTRAKESGIAIVLGARGFELKAGRISMLFPAGPPRVEAAPDLERGEIVLARLNPGLAQYVATGDASRLLEPGENVIRCGVLPPDATPAELYS